MKSKYFHSRFPFGKALLCSIVILVFTTQAAAQSSQSATFVTFNSPLLGNTPMAADLNGDGRLDLAGSD